MSRVLLIGKRSTQLFNPRTISWCQNKQFLGVFNKKNVFRYKYTEVKPLQQITQNSNHRSIVGKWLLGCSGMVYVAVILGGVTRLTESGLSMVSWKLLGEKMPRTKAEWEAEFLNYQQFPEFKMKNSTMTTEEFKFIYFMEYFHRMWGRAIGAFFFLPAAYFWHKKYLSGTSKKIICLLGTLIALQGLMGWYMVKSGLEDRFQDVNDVPRVSQHRLATHLGLAFLLYVICLSTALSKLLPAQKYSSPSISSFRKFALAANVLTFFTAISGAFVAGLDAGLVYNSFPKMGDDWIPDDILALQPVQRNFTENPTTVQFDHRTLGLLTLFFVSCLWVLSRRAHLPKRVYWAINAVAITAWTQASLGVLTLLNHVPVPLATAHQSGSLLLLSFCVWLHHELRFLRHIPK